jgi:hypothetical protein
VILPHRVLHFPSSAVRAKAQAADRLEVLLRELQCLERWLSSQADCEQRSKVIAPADTSQDSQRLHLVGRSALSSSAVSPVRSLPKSLW